MRFEFDEFCRRCQLTKSMVVLVPHPDDEAIGCGGLIALAVRRGIAVYPVLVTDGTASHRHSIAWPQRALSRLRRQEFDQSLRVLGIEIPPLCLKLPDAGTAELSEQQKHEAVSKLQALLKKTMPDIILTTWRREPHCDHRFAHELAEAAGSAAPDAHIVEYMVWTPITGQAADFPARGESNSLRLVIDGVRHVKQAALAVHRSQLGQVVFDDPSGFSLTPDQINNMTCGDEWYEIDDREPSLSLR